MNALFKLALKGSALGAVALMTTAVGCSDSNKDEAQGAAGMSSAGKSNNNEAGGANTPGGADGGGTTSGGTTSGGTSAGGTDAGGAPVVEGGAPAGGADNAGGANTGPAIAKFCNDLTFGTEQDPMDTTMVLEVGEGADKVTFTATTGECVPADGNACKEIPTGTDVPVALYDADDLTTALDEGTVDSAGGENWIFYTDLSTDAEPAPVIKGGPLDAGGVCEDFTYADVYGP